MAAKQGSDAGSYSCKLKMDKYALEMDAMQSDSNEEEPKSSDDVSIISDLSEDSDMETFPEYLPKIESLLRDIGLDGFSVRLVQHGYTYQNCVYALDPPKDQREQYILRVPVCPDLSETDQKCEDIITEVSLLSYLIDKLPVPRVKAYSATTMNALKAPFSIQTRLPGQSLENVYDQLSHADKHMIVDQFVTLLEKIESVHFATAGHFTTSSELPDSMNDFSNTVAPLVTLYDGGDEEFVKEPTSVHDRGGPDVRALLVSHLNGWIAKELKGDEAHQKFIVPPFRRLLALINDLHQEGSLTDGPYPVFLSHWDLEPRNIMVEKNEGTWKICGIIDWDGASALPRPLARKPPAWIWDFEPDMFTGFLDNDHHPNDHFSDENVALKAYFDEKAAAVLPEYIQDAYGYGRVLRRVWTFVRDEIHTPWYLDLMDQLLRDWDERPRPAAC